MGKKVNLELRQRALCRIRTHGIKKPWWMEDDPVKGHFTLERCNPFDFLAPLCRFQSSMVFFISCGCILQRAY